MNVGGWLLFSFIVILGPSPWHGATNIQGVSYLTSLEMLSQTFPEECFHGDSKSIHVDNQD